MQPSRPAIDEDSANPEVRNSGAFGMTHLRVILTVAILMGSCVSQENGAIDPKVALPLLQDVLGKARTSGSLAYGGRCDVHKPYPDFPALKYPSSFSESTVDVLKQVFSNIPKMQVTQDANGVVRMFETDVPTDLLDVRISYISFDPSDDRPREFGGPNNAKTLVLSTSEVVAYKKGHNIGPFTDVWIRPGDTASEQRVSGILHNVTVKQALDYILQFYPGFWIYENCQTDDAKPGRNVFIDFYLADLPRTNSGSAR
jgi:hypothetical protein